MNGKKENTLLPALEVALPKGIGEQLDRKEGTKHLSEIIAGTARSLGYRCIPEYPAGLINGRNSYIDFVCTMRLGLGKTFCIAIELDSSNKELSTVKLEEMKARGFIPIWIRWKTPIHITTPPDIYLIDLT
jgi:hypothetical protein